MNKRFKRLKWGACFLLAFALAFSLISSVLGAYSFTSDGIIIARDDGSGFSYDYAPSVIVEGSSTKIWWCGRGSTGNDVVWYSEKIGSGSFSTPSTVLSPSQTWESTHTCDPSVIKGSFTMGGNSYTYAMYYGAADATNMSTKIGVAFSNNGTSWTKYSANPIISNADSIYDYGIGMMSAYSTGGSNVTLSYFDQKRNNATIVRTSTDGISFSNPFRLPFSGLDTSGDLAYSAAEEKWYFSTKNQEAWNGADYSDREMYLFRTNGSSLTNNDWAYIGAITSSLTGYYRNHNPGFYREGNGNLYVNSGNKYVAYGAQTANWGTFDPNSWDIGRVTVSGLPDSVPAPGSFSLSLPSNGVTGIDPFDTNFSWASSSDANNYILTVSESSSLNIYDSNVSTPLITSVHATSYRSLRTSYNEGLTHNMILEPNKTYYWSVKAVNTQGQVVASNGPFSFTTADSLTWKFDGADYEKWSAETSSSTAGVGAGRAVFNLSASDNLISRGGDYGPIKFDLSAKNKIVARLKNKSSANTIRVYYKLMDDPYSNAYHYKDFKIVPNDKYYREYVFDMTGSAGWGTAGKRLAILKFNFNGTGSAEFDQIQITGNNFARKDIKGNVLRVQAAGSSHFDAVNYPSGNAIDGHAATMWVSASHTGENYTESLIVDTGKSDKITKIRFTPRSDGLAVPKDFKIYVSDDQGNWGTEVVTQTNYPVVTTEQVFTLSTPKAGRYIKFEATKLRTDGGNSYFLQIPELHADRDTTNYVSISNADFENQTTDWNKWSNNGNTSILFAGTTGIADLSPVNGSQYYAAIFDANGTGASFSRVISSLQAGAAYKITVWAAAAGREARLVIRNYGGSEVYTSTTAGSWTPISQTVTLGSSNTSLEIHLYAPTGSAYSYALFDNVEMIKQ